jgi:hypothetical protein
MGMKKKKAEKTLSPKTAGKSPDGKETVHAVNRVQETPGPVLSNISRTLGTLLDRTRAYIRTSGKAEA